MEQFTIISRLSSKSLKSLVNNLSLTIEELLPSTSTESLISKVKDVLLLWGPLTLLQPLQLSAEAAHPLASESSPDLKRKLTSKIKRQMRVVEGSLIELVVRRLTLAKVLKQLFDIFISSSSNTKNPATEFYRHLEAECKMKKRSFQNHQRYLKFLTNYQRFQLVPVTFTDLLKMISSIEIWFKSEECSRLSQNNCSSQAYWKWYGTDMHSSGSVGRHMEVHGPASEVNPYAQVPAPKPTLHADVNSLAVPLPIQFDAEAHATSPPCSSEDRTADLSIVNLRISPVRGDFASDSEHSSD